MHSCIDVQWIKPCLINKSTLDESNSWMTHPQWVKEHIKYVQQGLACNELVNLCFHTWVKYVRMSNYYLRTIICDVSSYECAYCRVLVFVVPAFSKEKGLWMAQSRGVTYHHHPQILGRIIYKLAHKFYLFCEFKADWMCLVHYPFSSACLALSDQMHHSEDEWPENKLAAAAYDLGMNASVSVIL